MFYLFPFVVFLFFLALHHAVIDYIDTDEIYGSTLNFSQLFLIKRLSYGAETVTCAVGKVSLNRLYLSNGSSESCALNSQTPLAGPQPPSAFVIVFHLIYD